MARVDSGRPSPLVSCPLLFPKKKRREGEDKKKKKARTWSISSNFSLMYFSPTGMTRGGKKFLCVRLCHAFRTIWSRCFFFGSHCCLGSSFVLCFLIMFVLVFLFIVVVILLDLVVVELLCLVPGALRHGGLRRRWRLLE